MIRKRMVMKMSGMHIRCWRLQEVYDDYEYFVYYLRESWFQRNKE